MHIHSSAAAVVALSTAALAQPVSVPTTVIARTGDSALTGAPGDVLTGFVGLPSINADSRVAFIGSLTQQGAPSTAIYSDRSGVLQLAALAGTPIAPASSDPARAWATFTTATRVLIADNGRITALATAMPAFPSSQFGADASAAIVCSAADGGDPRAAWSVRVVNGQPIPSIPGAVVNAQVLNAGVSAATGSSECLSLFTGHAVEIADTDAGLTVVDNFDYSPNTSLIVVAPTGSSGGGAFGYYGRTSGTSFQAFVRGRVGARSGNLLTAGQTIQLEGQPGQWFVGFNQSLGTVTRAIGDQQLIVPCLIGASSPATRNAILRLTQTGNAIVAIENDSVNGTGSGPPRIANLSSAFNYSVNESGAVLGAASLYGPNPGDNGQGLCLFRPGTPHTHLARYGDPVLELPGYTISIFASAAISSSDRVVFDATIRQGDGPSVSATFGIDAAGRARLLVANGLTRLQLPGAGLVTVTNHTNVYSSGGNDGQRRNVNDDAFATTASYAGGQAVVLLTIPCPADIAAAGAELGFDGQLDNNDFIVFINQFFAANPIADFGSAGGVAGSDGLYDNNDFIAFITQFFDGCE